MRWTACCAMGSAVLLLGGPSPAQPRTAFTPAAPAAPAGTTIPPGEVRSGPADDYLERAVRYGFSGAALIARDGEVILSRAYGMAERDRAGNGGVPNALDTRFDIGAISMQFTAAAILRLQVLGKLNIDDPVSKFFEETVVLGIPAESRRITLHQLMSHTSGLHGGAEIGDVDAEDRDVVVAAALSAASPFPAGTSFGYTATNYIILAAVIERITGKAFEAAMHELIFAPAGMTRTTFCGDQLAEEVACGHEDLPPRAPPGEYVEPVGDVGPGNFRPFNWTHRGTTGVLTTVGDLYRWHTALKTDRILSAEARKVFFTPVRQQYACGWQVMRDENALMMIHHGGTTVGFEAGFARWSDDAGNDRGVVILLMNSRRGLGQRLQATMAKFALTRPGAALPEPPPRPVAVDRASLERMVGVYRLPTGGAVEMSIQEGKLIASPAGQDASAMLNLPTAHLAPVLARASGRAGTLLRGWMTGDERDVRAYAAAIHPAVPEGAAANWTQRWSSDSRPDAPLTAIEVLGSFVGQEGLQTAVRLRYADEVEVVRIFWRQDQVYGIGAYEVLEGIRTEDDADPASAARGRSAGLAVHLLPESNASFAAMEPERWTVLRIMAQPAQGPRAMSIILKNGEQMAEAKRE